MRPIVHNFPSLISAIVAVLGLFFSWKNWREAQLRRSDVLAWSNRAISAMTTLRLVCKLGESYFSSRELEARLKELCVETSILIEQGRMFFKNVETKNHGQGKEPAYRGFRPLILDHLLVAHEISLRWLDTDDESRKSMCVLANDHLQKFVSLVQKEVGRSRTASKEGQTVGDRIEIQNLRANVARSE
jgi:hypothetical protein